MSLSALSQSILMCISISGEMVVQIGLKSGPDDMRRRLILGNSFVTANEQLICNRKRRSTNSKHVSFAPKLIQNSSTKKSIPQETIPQDSIFVGDFACKLNLQSDLASSRAQNSNMKSYVDAIPFNVVFDRIKGQMSQNKQFHVESKGADCYDEPNGIGWHKDSHLRCFHCLGLGHFARSFTNPIWCRHCFCYGHVQKKCFRWRAMGWLKWAPKVKHPSGVNLEPNADGMGSTIACLTLSPRSSLEKTTAAGSSSTMTLPLPSSQTTMVNFTIDPQPFVPPAMFLKDGDPHHRAHNMVYINGAQQRRMRIVRLQSMKGSFPWLSGINYCMTSTSTSPMRSGSRSTTLLCILMASKSSECAMLVRGLL
jgi:hypothetical protein